MKLKLIALSLMLGSMAFLGACSAPTDEPTSPTTDPAPTPEEAPLEAVPEDQAPPSE